MVVAVAGGDVAVGGFGGPGQREGGSGVCDGVVAVKGDDAPVAGDIGIQHCATQVEGWVEVGVDQCANGDTAQGDDGLVGAAVARSAGINLNVHIGPVLRQFHPTVVTGDYPAAVGGKLHQINQRVAVVEACWNQVCQQFVQVEHIATGPGFEVFDVVHAVGLGDGEVGHHHVAACAGGVTLGVCPEGAGAPDQVCTAATFKQVDVGATIQCVVACSTDQGGASSGFERVVPGTAIQAVAGAPLQGIVAARQGVGVLEVSVQHVGTSGIRDVVCTISTDQGVIAVTAGKYIIDGCADDGFWIWGAVVGGHGGALVYDG